MTSAERVFRPILNLPIAGVLMNLLALPLPLVAWLGLRQDPNLPAALFIATLGLGVSGLGVFFIVRFSGRFHLTDTHLRRVRFGRVASVALADVIQFEERPSQLVSFLRLRTADARLDVPSQLTTFPELERALQQRLAHLRPSPPAAPPLTLRLPRRYYASHLLPLLLLMLLMGVPLLLLVGSESSLALRDTIIFLGLFGGFLVFIVVVNENGDPYRLVLGETAVSAHYLHKTHVIQAVDVQKISRVKRVRTYRGFTRITYPIVITPATGKPLQIEEQRIWQIGTSPEPLLALLHRFYDTCAVANRLRLQGQPRQAARAYQARLQVAPNDAAAWRGLGQSLLAVGQWRQAANALEHAIHLAPDDGDALYAAALAHARQRSETQAATYLQRAIQIQPEHARAARQEAALNPLLPT